MKRPLSEGVKNFLKHNTGKKIISTSGCFDLLHLGHIQYLKEARELGDALIIGLNSDESVKKLKGQNRPINSEEDRKVMLEALKFVDAVQIFDEDTPVEFLKTIRPTFFVKGGDYDVTKIPEYPVMKELGGGVKKLTFKEGHSSTLIIEKIKSL